MYHTSRSTACIIWHFQAQTSVPPPSTAAAVSEARAIRLFKWPTPSPFMLFRLFNSHQSPLPPFQARQDSVPSLKSGHMAKDRRIFWPLMRWRPTRPTMADPTSQPPALHCSSPSGGSCPGVQPTDLCSRTSLSRNPASLRDLT